MHVTTASVSDGTLIRPPKKVKSRRDIDLCMGVAWPISDVKMYKCDSGKTQQWKFDSDTSQWKAYDDKCLDWDHDLHRRRRNKNVKVDSCTTVALQSGTKVPEKHQQWHSTPELTKGYRRRRSGLPTVSTPKKTRRRRWW